MVTATGPLRARHVGPPRHGLFFAIMIPLPEHAQLTACFQGFQSACAFRSRPIEPDRLHVSLLSVFVGDDLPEEEIRTAIRAGDAIRFEPFALTFSSALTFRNSRSKMPFVLASQKGAEAINGLRFEIGTAHSTLSGSHSYRHTPINPHITLIWDYIAVPERPISPLTMIVQEFALVHSHIGLSRYDVLKRWPLARFKRSQGRLSLPVLCSVT